MNFGVMLESQQAALYRKLGMDCSGGCFYKGEIPYFKMSMQLTNT